MWAKLMGSILVIAASSAMGYVSGQEYRKRLEELDYLVQILQMLSGEISYAKSTFQEAFGHIGKRVRNPYGTWMLNLSRELEEGNKRMFAAKWERSVILDLQESRLSARDKEELQGLGRQMGYLDEQMQLGMIALYRERLEVEIQRGMKGMQERLRVRQCVGILVGVFLVIILL